MVEALSEKISAHAGMSLALSTTSLVIMLAVLMVLLVGVRLGRTKNKDSLRDHRFAMTFAILLGNVAVILVMLPAFWNFYTDPKVQVFSTLSLATLAHAFTGFFAEVVGIEFAFNVMPTKIKTWMRSAAFLWTVAIAMGITVFVLMLVLV